MTLEMIRVIAWITMMVMMLLVAVVLTKMIMITVYDDTSREEGGGEGKGSSYIAILTSHTKDRRSYQLS